MNETIGLSIPSEDQSKYPMHHYQHMGYPITYHQRIAVPTFFFHSSTLFHIQFFILNKSRTQPHPHLQKNCCQVLPTPFRGRANAHFIGFLKLPVHHTYPPLGVDISSPKKALKTAKARFWGFFVFLHCTSYKSRSVIKATLL